MASKTFPTLMGSQSELAYKIITTKGFDEIANFDQKMIGDAFKLTIRIALSVINISHFQDPLEKYDFGEVYDTPWGGITQRLAINPIQPVSPAWLGLENGDTVDPFVINQADVTERFYEANFNYQGLLTVRDLSTYRNLFTSEYGIDTLMAGYMEQLSNAYGRAVYTAKVGAINAMINDTGLQPTQQIVTSYTGADTEDSSNLLDFILKVNNVVEMLSNAPSTDAFNIAGFDSTQDRGRLRLLIRAGVMNNIKVNVLSSAFNRDDLNFDVKLVPVANFGGLESYTDADFNTQAYPVYNKLGSLIGYSATQGSATAEFTKKQVYWKDPNENVLAVLADKGIVFRDVQNSYQVNPIYNPRGLYTNYWASAPNNGLHYDKTYNMVVFYYGEG